MALAAANTDMTAKGAQAAARGRPWIAIFALITLMVPVSIDVGSLHMTPSRAFFLLTSPFLLVRLISGKYGRFNAVDGLVLSYMAWRTMIPFIHNPDVALQYAGSNSVIFLGGYLCGRCSIRTATDFRIAAKMLGAFVIFSVPFAISEAITGRMVIPRFLDMIPFISSVDDVNYRRRMGIDRVQFVFAHPILYGLFCSLGVATYFTAMKGFMLGVRRWISSGLLVLAVFLSVSSGPFLATLVQLALLIWGFLLRNVGPRWKILGILAVVAYIILELASTRPAIYAITSILAFDPATANVRRILLEYGLAQVARTPILGIGFNQWDLPFYMSGSLDNFWLANALVFGIPAFVLYFASFVWALISVGRRDFPRGSPLSNIRLGWAVVQVSVILTLATVYIWSEIASLVMFVLGSGLFLLEAEQDDGTEKAPEPASTTMRTAGPVFTRFPPGEGQPSAKAVAPRDSRPVSFSRPRR